MTERLDSNDTERDSDSLYAAFGILAQTGSGTGPAPDETELQNYLTGKLDEQRSREVRSHLAHDPSILERAIGLIGSESLPGAAETPLDASVVDASARFSWRSRWRSRAFLTGAGVLAASVLIAVGLFVIGGGDSSSPQRVRVIQPPPAAASSVEQEAALIRMGFEAGDVSGGGVSGGPLGNAFSRGCTGDCSDRDKLLQFGATLRSFDTACRDGSAIGADARASLRVLASGPDAITGDPWRRYVMDLVAAESRSDRELCQVTSRMTEGLKN